MQMGGPDPTGNMRLKLALSKAKANNIPKDNIQRAIKKGQGAAEGGNYEEITYEGYGPAGVAVMVSKGVFSIDAEENEGLTEDDLMMIALDAGAEDVKSEDGAFEIITQPEDFDAVEKALADNNVEVAMSEITMIPDTMASLDEEGVAKVQKMLDALDDLDDVQDVYTNADLPDDEE